jgi:ribose transport system substrate-binding protein
MATSACALTRRDAVRLGAVHLAGLLAAGALAGCGAGNGDGSVGGRSAPGPVLPPFDDTRPAGPPTSLAKRVAWANTAETEIFTALGNGMHAAARDTGLDYVTANAGGNPQTNVSQMNTFLARGVGAMTVQPLNSSAQEPVMQQAIDAGVCLIGIINHPCTLQIAASQYDIGLTQGRAAAHWIRTRLDGRATVLNLNQTQTSPQLALRNRGVLAGLKTAGPGVRVIDRFATVEQQSLRGAFDLMTTVLQSTPDVAVVLGDDTPVVGAYRAVQQSGRLRDEMYFGGVDGDANALALIKQGGPYRASQSFAWPLMGYGMGRFAADWIAGRQIPRVMVAQAVLLRSAEEIDRFTSDNRVLEATFGDRRRYEKYFPLLGNISHATRERYWKSDYVPR